LNSDLWFHALSPNAGMILTCGPDRVFRIQLQTSTTDVDFEGLGDAMQNIPSGQIARVGELQRRLAGREAAKAEQSV
jgi:hypothetical protein